MNVYRYNNMIDQLLISWSASKFAEENGEEYECEQYDGNVVVLQQFTYTCLTEEAVLNESIYRFLYC